MGFCFCWRSDEPALLMGTSKDDNFIQCYSSFLRLADWKCFVPCERIEMWRFKCWVPLMSETAAFRQTLITPPAQLWHHIPGKLWELICTLNGGSFCLSSFLRTLNVTFIYDSIGIKMYAYFFLCRVHMYGWVINLPR